MVGGHEHWFAGGDYTGSSYVLRDGHTIWYDDTVAMDVRQTAPTRDDGTTDFVTRNEAEVIYRSHQLEASATWDETADYTVVAVIEGRPKKPEPRLKPPKPPPPWMLHIAAEPSPHRGLRGAEPRDARQQVWACRPRHGLSR